MSLLLVLSLVAGAQAAPETITTPAPTEAERPAPDAPAPRVSATRAFAPTGGTPGILERTWRLERLNGETVTPDVTLRLARSGLATGSTGCNRFSAEYELDGSSLRIATRWPRTLLVCAPAVGRLEARVRESLLRVQTWTITPTGDLSLELNGGGNLVFHAI